MRKWCGRAVSLPGYWRNMQKKSHNGKVEAVLQRDGKKSIKVNGLPARKIAELMGL